MMLVAIHLCGLELHLVLRVYQVQNLKAGWFYLEHVCFKVLFKSDQGNAARDAWGKPCATYDSPVCRTSGK